MADATKSLWSRLMENGSGNLSSVGAAKGPCPHERKSCAKAHGEGTPRSSIDGCNSDCPEPKRPLQPEEFCPELGKPTPPRCCFIRMQDPCAPCCCPPPNNCEDECHPVPKREPTCGCDLCKKKRCPDGKCCGPTEPSCQKAGTNLIPVLRRRNSESQTSEGYSRPLETQAPGILRHRKHPCRPPVIECKKNDASLFQLIKRPLDWLLCTPLKIPVPHIEWRSIKDSKQEEDHGSYTSPFTLKCTHRYSHDSLICNCGPCRVRRVFEKSRAGRTGATDPGDKPLKNCHSDACHCRLCQVRRVLEEPIC